MLPIADFLFPAASDTVTDYPLLAFAARFLQSDVRLLKHENKQLKSQNKTLDTKTKDLRDELLIVKREKRKTEHQLHTRIRTLENDNRVLQRGLDSANHYIATNREVDIVERAKLRMQAEEALMQLEANERQMAKREDELDAVVAAARSSLESQLAKRAHIISNLELAVSNHRGYEESLRQRNDDLRQRNRDLRLQHNALLRKLATDAVTLSRLTMTLKERHEPAVSLPSSNNNTAAAQAGVTSLLTIVSSSTTTPFSASQYSRCGECPLLCLLPSLIGIVLASRIVIIHQRGPHCIARAQLN